MSAHPPTPQGSADRGEGLAGYLDLQLGHDQFETPELIEVCSELSRSPDMQPDFGLLLQDIAARLRSLAAERVAEEAELANLRAIKQFVEGRLEWYRLCEQGGDDSVTVEVCEEVEELDAALRRSAPFEPQPQEGDRG